MSVLKLIPMTESAQLQENSEFVKKTRSIVILFMNLKQVTEISRWKQRVRTLRRREQPLTWRCLGFHPAAFRSDPGRFGRLSALSVVLSEPECESIPRNPPVPWKQPAARSLYVCNSLYMLRCREMNIPGDENMDMSFITTYQMIRFICFTFLHLLFT